VSTIASTMHLRGSRLYVFRISQSRQLHTVCVSILNLSTSGGSALRHATIVCNGVAIEFNVGDLVFQGDMVPQQFDARSRSFRRQRLTLNENARLPRTGR
jgi:hypothetical protein